MVVKKNLLINQIKIARLQDANCIPTWISYKGKTPQIGVLADNQENPDNLVFDNFKVDLGRQNGSVTTRKQFHVSDSHKRSILGITKDFLESFCSETEMYLSQEGLSLPNKVLVAEPLSLEEDGQAATGQWLANYRSGVRTALSGKFKEIDFLPEPFAVYQYYRYGIRHPLLSEGKSHVALVLDFGGGTFDVSIIETTSNGDISRGGKNARPLGAKSIPVGGFYINKMISETLLFDVIVDKKIKSQSRSILQKVKNFHGFNDEELIRFGEREKAFIFNFRKLLKEVEDAKVRICNSIADWRMNCDLDKGAAQLVNCPIDPFNIDTDWGAVQLKAEQLRSIFETKVWNPKLKDSVKKAIERAKDELERKPISIALLSGGSTNIGWTKELLLRDLHEVINEADIVEISDSYQEVVAKGLAVECARQFYTTGDGDFGAVTYNRLNLLLKPNDKVLEYCKFKPLTEGLPKSDETSVLLPSATSLRGFINKEMSWKIQLKSAPRNNLEYYFLKSSFDPTDTSSLHNIIDNSVKTPKNTKFGQSIEMKLVVREDGTAIPSFIYGKGKNEETQVDGNPFFLDMTFAGNEIVNKSYLGLDFGTATSAASYVEHTDIKAFEARSKSKSWVELNDLVENLPYPIAAPLAQYITQTNRVGLDKYGLFTFEAFLTFIAYVSFCDLKASGVKNIPKIRSGFNRSAGPLWNWIRELANINIEDSKLAHRLLKIITGEYYEEVNQAVSEVPKIKHDKIAQVDFNRILKLLGNHLNYCCNDWMFGRFEQVSKKGFGLSGYDGIYRLLHGHSQHFIGSRSYQGSYDFSSEELFIANAELKTAIPLTPLLVWGLGDKVKDGCINDLFLLDQIKDPSDRVAFKSVREGNDIKTSEHNCLKEFSNLLDKTLNENDVVQTYDDIQLEKLSTL